MIAQTVRGRTGERMIRYSRKQQKDEREHAWWDYHSPLLDVSLRSNVDYRDGTSNRQFKQIPISTHSELPAWNYTIGPN